MKTFEDLTKEEKDKIQMYLKIRSLSNTRIYVIIFVAMMMYIPGIILLFASDLSLFFLGIALVFMAVVSVLFAFFIKETDNKYLQLSFGIETLMEDAFKIKKEDINSLKRVWRVVK